MSDSGESLLVAVAKLEAAKHTHANKLQEHSLSIADLGGRMTTAEREVAVVQSEVQGLRGTVTTGFADLRNVIIVRAEAEAEARARDHELALGLAADRRALVAKVLGLIATALTIAGGGGGALYAMSDGDPPERPPVVAPVAP